MGWLEASDSRLDSRVRRCDDDDDSEFGVAPVPMWVGDSGGRGGGWITEWKKDASVACSWWLGKLGSRGAEPPRRGNVERRCANTIKYFK